MIDVCLLLEGTYPYVSGGVSSWVSDIVNNLKGTTFSIVYLGAQFTTRKKLNYKIPSNVIDFRELYIFDYEVDLKRKHRTSKKDMSILKEFLLSIRRGDIGVFDEFVKKFRSGEIDFYDIIISYDSWKILEEVYESEAGDESFIDYFWTWRFIYLPFLSLLKADLPIARVYHSVSTGYAGVLGTLAKTEFSRPFLLTEHGLYTRERKIDISQADWIFSGSQDQSKITKRDDFFKDWWISLFSYFSRIAYQSADEILTLFEDNRKEQIKEKADPEKTSIIPNGVEFEELNALPREPSDGVFRIGFMGRVVPIKDVKTFILACSITKKTHKDIEVYIMGPTEEDEEYYRECLLLCETQGLSDIIKFTGKIAIKEYYPKIDVIVLTSISEGQPIVILEASSCGIPVVASDVGACRELLYGREEDDKLIGPSGIITAVSSPEETAEAIIKIINDKALYKSMAKAAKTRVKTYYQMTDLLAKYNTLYQHYLEEIRW